MSNEIVTVEYNGEVFELQVPTGSSQEDIETFLGSQESPEAAPIGDESMPSLEQEEPLTDMGEWGDRGITKYTGELVGEVKEAGLDLLALTEVAGTIGTGAVSSITAAAFGATAMLFGRDPEQTASDVEHYSQLGTYMPKGERGQELLEDIAEPLMQLEEGASDLSWYLADGNVAAATAIKTTLLGAAELALPSKGAIKGMKTGRELRKRAAEMERLADDLGVDISQSGLAASIVALAKRMTPDQRATHMPYLRDQLKAASEKAIARKNQLYEEARASESFVDSASASELSASIRKDLEFEGYVLSDKKLRNLRERLDELANMKPDETGTRVNLKEYDDVRKKINTMRSAKNKMENRALNIMNKRMGEFLDAEFDKIALGGHREFSAALAPDAPKGHTRLYRAESPTVKFDDIFDAGKMKSAAPKSGHYYTSDLGYAEYFKHAYNQNKDASIKYIDVPNKMAAESSVGGGEYILSSSALSGETAGVAAWKAARGAARDWHKRFNTDKVIVKFLNKDASAETMAQWLLGASAMGANREAGMIVGRMKEVLGDTHPAIQGIRTDLLFEVASPLLHPDGPNFNQFVRNYEMFIEKNPTLVEALNLKMGDFKELHDLARLQKTLPHNEAGMRDIMKRVTTITSRLAVGHEIAKAGVKVNLFRDALNLTLQLDRITQKQMFYELAGMKYGDVLLPKKSPLAGQFIAGAALTEIADTQELDPSQE
jgi:hypothetical protein